MRWQAERDTALAGGGSQQSQTRARLAVWSQSAVAATGPPSLRSAGALHKETSRNHPISESSGLTAGAICKQVQAVRSLEYLALRPQSEKAPTCEEGQCN